MPFNTNADTHTYHTRQDTNIHHPLARHEYAKKCIRYDIPQIVNKTPAIILNKIDTHSLSGFSWYIKQYTINLYSEMCNIQSCYICSRQ